MSDSFNIRITGPFRTSHERVNTMQFHVVLTRNDNKRGIQKALHLGREATTLIEKLERLSSMAFENRGPITAFRSTTGAGRNRNSNEGSANYGEGPANIIFANGTMAHEIKTHVKESFLHWLEERRLTYTEKELEDVQNVVIDARVSPQV